MKNTMWERMAGAVVAVGVVVEGLRTFGSSPVGPGTGLGKIEIVHQFHRSMPTGITVSQSGRVLVNYPR